MNISGYFPDRDIDWANSNLYYVWHENGCGSTSYSLKAEDRALVQARFESLVAQHAGLFSTQYSRPHGLFGPWRCTVTGDIPPPYMEQRKLPDVRSNNNPAFKRSKRTDDIIVSAYAKGSVLITERAGMIPSYVGSPSYYTCEPSELFTRRTPCGTAAMDDRRGLSGTIYFTARRKVMNSGLMPADIPSYSREAIVDAIKALTFPQPSSALMTNCLSEANRGTLDVLTSLAEMPETVRSIVGACTQVLRMYRDAKNKEVRLVDKAKRVREGSQTAAQAKKTSSDLASAIADVWMQFRYNITPNKILIEDLIKTLDSLVKKFIRFRDTEHTELKLPELEGWTQGDLRVTDRCFIKRLVSAESDWEAFMNATSANIAVTAWELVPLSFVVDWFINIGDFLSAFLPVSDYTEACSISRKIDATVVYTHNETGATATFEVKSYYRTPTDPSGWCQLTFNPDISSYRQMDSIALIWGRAKRLL